MLISISADTAHTPRYVHENKTKRTNVERMLNDSTAKILTWQEEQSLGVCARAGR